MLLFFIKTLPCFALVTPRKLLNHGTVVRCVIASDMTDLQKTISNDKARWSIIHTLWTIPRRTQILNKACPKRWPLCAVFICVKPKRPCSSFHCPGSCSSIQWPVTAKYPSAFDACHASHVRLIFPETYLLAFQNSVIRRAGVKRQRDKWWPRDKRWRDKQRRDKRRSLDDWWKMMGGR